MRTVLIASTSPYSGKSGIALSVLNVLAERGFDAGYFKPYGAMPVTIDGVRTDEDAHYINKTLPHPSPVDAVCPVVATSDFISGVLDGTIGEQTHAVSEAFAACSAGRDVMVVEGPTDSFQGASVGISVPQVATILDAHVLLVARPMDGPDLPDSVICEAHRLEGRLAGVVLNWVQEWQMDFVRTQTAPFIRARGIPVFGILPYEPVLSSVTVAEIADALNGTVLSAEEHLDEPVESFMVGAMGQDKALRFFRRKARKAVITGGDRADVQLAALETSTQCIILTGNMPPSSIVLARAEELGVPMLLVESDTLTAVERMESLMGRTRLHDETKVARIREMFDEAVDCDALFRAIGLI